MLAFCFDIYIYIYIYVVFQSPFRYVKWHVIQHNAAHLLHLGEKLVGKDGSVLLVLAPGIQPTSVPIFFDWPPTRGEGHPLVVTNKLVFIKKGIKGKENRLIILCCKNKLILNLHWLEC